MSTQLISKRSPSEFENDVCLSFAGEDRNYVRKVAEGLRKRGVRVFFDEYEKASLWGKDLYVHLDDIYRKSAYYCILFASENYKKRLWTNHERISAQARAIEQNEEYILPVRFDDTEIPGLRPTIGYIDLRITPCSELIEIICEKLDGRVYVNFLPPDFDLLHDIIVPKNKTRRERTEKDARAFFQAMLRMAPEERKIVFKIFMHGCSHELPDNYHIEKDLLCRISGYPPSKVKRILRGLGSLGFRMFERKHATMVRKRVDVIALEWHNLSVGASGDSNSTFSVHAIVDKVTSGRCETCAWLALDNLDFSSLSSATIRSGHIHD